MPPEDPNTNRSDSAKLLSRRAFPIRRRAGAVVRVGALQEVSLHKAHVSGYPKPSHVGILGANPEAMHTALSTDRGGTGVAFLLAQA